MTPDKKAKQLIDKFQNTDIWLKQAKECTLIAISEIETALIECGELSDQLQNMDRELNFWQEVRNAIKTL